ncbi:hypothetical protein ACJQWK_07152 [Exserohilum turcicum]
MVTLKHDPKVRSTVGAAGVKTPKLTLQRSVQHIRRQALPAAGEAKTGPIGCEVQSRSTCDGDERHLLCVASPTEHSFEELQDRALHRARQWQPRPHPTWTW